MILILTAIGVAKSLDVPIEDVGSVAFSASLMARSFRATPPALYLNS